MSNPNHEEELYAQAAAELEDGNRDEGLWAKCFAECDGEENRAKARYIKTRAERLAVDEIEVGESKRATWPPPKRDKSHSSGSDESVHQADGTKAPAEVEPAAGCFLGHSYTYDDRNFFTGYLVGAFFITMELLSSPNWWVNCGTAIFSLIFPVLFLVIAYLVRLRFLEWGLPQLVADMSFFAILLLGGFMPSGAIEAWRLEGEWRFIMFAKAFTYTGVASYSGYAVWFFSRQKKKQRAYK
jgi:hypothetical protein